VKEWNERPGSSKERNGGGEGKKGMKTHAEQKGKRERRVSSPSEKEEEERIRRC
jgi:hypothetical protein